MRCSRVWWQRSQAPSSSSLLSVVSALTAPPTNTTFTGLLDHPQVPVTSLPFIPPPRWAAELSRRLQRRFPGTAQAHHTRYLQSFIHPSFTTEEGVSGTMRALSPLGEAVLLSVVSTWVVSALEGLRPHEVTSLLSYLLSDASLSRTLREAWELESMILTDASAELFSKEKPMSSKGLVQWLATSSTVPDPYAAECVKSLVGVVLLERNYAAAELFCRDHILPYICVVQ
ncbi:hypothetical protein STCU_00058 [Strigomonas culicis]|nr:hypothetical protein STCU_00058 [Strigomonas culicis]|eukprot:EPY37239.1 hypothetical protein STCU_00058 [Strigomonas culicis]